MVSGGKCGARELYSCSSSRGTAGRSWVAIRRPGEGAVASSLATAGVSISGRGNRASGVLAEGAMGRARRRARVRLEMLLLFAKHIGLGAHGQNDLNRAPRRRHRQTRPKHSARRLVILSDAGCNLPNCLLRPSHLLRALIIPSPS